MKPNRYLFLILFAFVLLTSTYAQQEKVAITFKVVLLNPIPESESVFIMGDFNAWDPGNAGYGNSGWELAIELQKDSLGMFSTTEEFGLGDTVKYLYTRGSHYNIEYTNEGYKRNERKIIVDANKTIIDTVETWRDYFLSEVKKVIYIPFEKQNPEKIMREGKPWTIYGSLLYHEGMRNTFAKGYRISNQINKIPADLTDTISFPFVISDAPDNSIIILAGKKNIPDKWAIFVDQNNDNEIDDSEFVFEALETTDTTENKEDTVTVAYDNLVNSIIEKDTVAFIIGSYNKPLLDHYRSSLREDAPVLVYSLFSDLREGTLHYNNSNIKLGALPFYTGHNYGLRNWFNLLVDFNEDNKFDISKGSSENIEIFNESIDKPINLGDFALNILDVDNHGNWLKVFFSEKIESKIKNTTAGNTAPEWEGKTLMGENISSQSLIGKYVLLDFWASWCKPCHEELKHIKAENEKYTNNKLVIIGVIVDDTKERIQKFLNKNLLNWLQIFDDASIIKDKFSVKGIPDPILISPDGMIIERGPSLRGLNLGATLKKYLE